MIHYVKQYFYYLSFNENLQYLPNILFTKIFRFTIEQIEILNVIHLSINILVLKSINSWNYACKPIFTSSSRKQNPFVHER